MATGLAYQLAREAFQKNFSSRRGFVIVEDERGKPFAFYLYDNNPYPDPERRLREHAELVAYLETKGCKLVQQAAYPAKGKDAGYTVALVFYARDVVQMEETARLRHRDIVSRNENTTGEPTTPS